MGNFIEGIATNAANSLTGGIIGAGMGLMLEGHNDRRQLEQQQKLMDMQIAANKDMANFNYQNQMKMWKETNFGPQVEELKKAGLNPALLYAKGGTPGQTTSAQAQGVNTGEAPKGGGESMGLMLQNMQMQLMDAQRKNIQADTANKEADTANKPKVGQNIEASTASLTQGINNAKAQEALTKTENKIKEIELEILDATQGYQSDFIAWNARKMEQDARQALRENKIGEATQNDKIATIHGQMIGIYLANELIHANTGLAKAHTTLAGAQTTLAQAHTEESKSNVKVNEQQIKNMIGKIAQDWRQIELNANNQTETERNGSYNRFINDTQHSFQIANDIIEKALQAIVLKGLIGADRPTQIKGFKK